MSPLNDDPVQEDYTPVILERPFWGEIAYSLKALQQHRKNLLELVSGLGNDGGIFIIPFIEINEPSVLLFLTLLLGQIRQRGNTVQLYRSHFDPYIDPTILSSDYLLVHNLPQCNGLLELLEADQTKNRVVIATGIQEELEQIDIRLSHRFYRLFDGPYKGETLEKIQQQELEKYLHMGQSAKIYFQVALFDAWGIPLPFALLTRILDQSEDEVSVLVEEAQTQNLLYWIELEKPSALLVSTKAPLVARAMISTILHGKETDILAEYTKVIYKALPIDKGERYIILNLLQALLRGSYKWGNLDWGIRTPRREWLLKLISSSESSIEKLWQQGDATEILLWGKLFEELQDFKKSNSILRYGLSKNSYNKFLLQARAKMLGRWAQIDRDRYSEAETAFKQAAQQSPGNPYIWQAWGVMEAKRGSIREARSRFKQALDAAKRPNEKVYTLVAWANLELETREGNYDKTKELLAKIESYGSGNPYFLHTLGKLAFYEGRYQTIEDSEPGAENYFNKILNFDPTNLPALTTLADMASKRGQWGEAAKFLTRAVSINPENVPVLHELAELKVEKATLEIEIGNSEQADKYYDEAEEIFDQILRNERHNIRAVVALAVLCGKRAEGDIRQGKSDEATRRFQNATMHLEEAFEMDPDNKFALHALGELKRRQQEYLEAEHYFQEILKRDRVNLPALLSLANLRVTQKDYEQIPELSKKIKQILQAVLDGEISIPQYEIVRTYNAWVMLELKLGNGEKALELISKAYALDNKNAYTHRIYARILSELGKPEEALVHIEQAGKLAGI